MAQQLLKMEDLKDSVFGICDVLILFADLPKTFRKAMKTKKFGILGSFILEEDEWYDI